MLTDKEREDIRRKMLEFEEEPPVRAWANIQAEIKPRRKWRLFWWLSAALLLVTAIGLFFYANPLQLLSMAPSITADAPVLPTNPDVSAHKNSNVSSKGPATNIQEAQKPMVNPEQKKQPLPSEKAILPSTTNTPAPDNAEVAAYTSPKEAIRLAPTDKPVNGKPVNEKDRTAKPAPTQAYKNPDIGTAIAREHNKDLTGNPQPANKSTAENNGLTTKPFNAIEKTKSDTKKVQPVQNLSGKSVDPEKNVQHSKPSTHTDILPAPGYTRQTTGAKLTGEHSPGISNTESETIKDATSISEQKTIPGSLLEKSKADSASLVLKTDTTGYEKELIITRPQKHTSSNEWTVGLFFSPRYSFRIVTPSSSDNIYISGLNSRGKSGSERMGYEVGLSVSKAIGHNLYLESSLAFMQLKENVSYSYTTGKVDTLLRQGSSDGQQIQVTAIYATGTRQLTSSYAYGGWRLGATYYFWQNHRRRFNFTLNGGVNLLVKGRTKEVINGQESQIIYFPSKENILEQSNYNLLAGAGYSMRIMEKYELMLMPTLNYFLGSTFKSREPFGLQPYSLGIHMQLKRRLN